MWPLDSLHTSNKVLQNNGLDRPFPHLMPSGGGTLLFVITSTPSIRPLERVGIEKRCILDTL